MSATNFNTLKSLYTSLLDILKKSKTGGVFVKGGMYGVEQVAKILDSLTIFTGKAVSDVYEDIDNTNSSVVNIENEIDSTIGKTHKENLYLQPDNNNDKWYYIGNGGHKVLLPSSIDLITNGYTSWEVTLENGSVNNSNISIEANSGNVIDAVQSIVYNFGTQFVITWNGDDTFTSRSINSFRVINTAIDYTAIVNNIVLVDASINAITITLPSAVSSINGEINVKKIDSTNNRVVVNGGGNNIDGFPTFDLLFKDESVTVVSDGLNWFIV